MPDKIKLPIVGETSKGTVVIAGLAGVAALGWAWWHHKQEAQTAATQQSQTAGSAATGAAGYGYGYGYGYGAYSYQPYGYGYGPFGLGSYGGEGDYGYGYYGAGEPVNEEVPAAAVTNAQWSEAAMTALTAQGWSGQDVLTALGLYLTGAPVSSTQEGIIQAAIAAEGYPPAPGASGNPPGINVGSGGGGTGQTSTTSATSVKVPNFIGMDAVTAQQSATRAGLTSTLSGPPFTAGKGTRMIAFQNPKAGTSVAKGTSVTLGYKLVTGGTATELSGGKVVSTGTGT